MTNRTDQELEKLRREALQAAVLHDRIDEAAARGKIALLHLSRLKWQEAAVELLRVAVLAEQDGEPFYEAQTRYTLGRALGHLPPRQTEGIGHLQRAADLYQQTGHPAQAIASRKAIAEIYMAAEQYQLAIELTTELLASQPPLELGRDLYRLRAVAHLYNVQLAEGAADMARAAELASQQGDPQLAALLTSQARALRDLANGSWDAPALGALLANGAIPPELGGEGLTDKQLQKALASLQHGRIAQGLAQAEAALQAARDAADLNRFVRYLLASLLIAQAHESQNNRVGVLIALLRAKVYLETNVGTAVGAQVDAVLDGFGQQWGADGLRQAIAEYQQHIATHGPIKL